MHRSGRKYKECFMLAPESEQVFYFRLDRVVQQLDAPTAVRVGGSCCARAVRLLAL